MKKFNPNLVNLYYNVAMKVLSQEDIHNYLSIVKSYHLEDLISFSKSVRVLYVDEDSKLKEDSLSIFKIFFHDVDVASNGEDALELFKKNKYDLIITALDMPVMSGLKMIEEIRKISRNITILILSSEQKYFIDLIRLSIDGYILKPVEIPQFVSIMQKVIETLYNKQILYEYRIDLEENVKEKTKELQALNNSLEERIQIEIEKNLENEKHIFEQAKMASMGEMISNIAHQWRQPLSVISTVSSGLALKIEFNQFEEEEAKKDLSFLTRSVEHLSETIDTFRDFIRENKQLKEVILQDRINKALNMAEVSLKSRHVSLINNIDYDHPISVKLVLGELIQVILNIINNAVDALTSKKIEKPWIKIALKKNKNNTVTITIEDNAQGIPEEIINRIFEPYFTTKHKSQGTGLGLYMSYQIVTTSLKGKLHVQNTNNGAKFFIELPL